MTTGADPLTFYKYPVYKNPYMYPYIVLNVDTYIIKDVLQLATIIFTKPQYFLVKLGIVMELMITVN
jgi:hypothetical protein